MRWRIFLIGILAAFNAGVSCGQFSTLHYKFVNGESCVYEYVFDQTWVQRDGAHEDSFVHTVVMRFEVEAVDDAGNGTLLCTVIRQGYVKKGKGQGTTARQLSDTLIVTNRSVQRPLDELPSQKSLTLMGIRPDVTPKFRVVLSPNGQYVSGAILEKSDCQKQQDALRREPNTEVQPLDIDATLMYEIGLFIRPLPTDKVLVPGVAWSDTVYKQREGKILGGLSGGTITYSREQRDFSCETGAISDSIPCLLFSEQTSRMQQTPSSTSNAISIYEAVGHTRNVFDSRDDSYRGYRGVWTSEMSTKADLNAEAVVRYNGKTVTSVTLLDKE
ncbi:MAG: hypothetical protein HY962_08020 [Ignavibacteriae bacterium]|nr:hypothetical protein [Ignavibacteriota bacterium]